MITFFVSISKGICEIYEDRKKIFEHLALGRDELNLINETFMEFQIDFIVQDMANRMQEELNGIEKELKGG